MRVIYMMATLILLDISIRDIRTKTISDVQNGCILLLGIAALIITKGRNPAIYERIAGFFALSIPLLLANVIRPGGIGGGDIKLMASAGFLLGWYDLLEAAFWGFFLAALYSCALISFGHKKRSDTYALGPFLSFGIILKFLLKMTFPVT